MKRLFSISLILIISFLFIPSVQAQTATLYLLPSTGNYTVGSTFSIDVKVNSGGVAINAAEGSLTFNTEELNVVSISKTGSIFSLWTTEPTFSNSAGTINFGGGTPTNFSGASGTIITISFKAKRVTTTNVNFISGAVLAADGKGTNVLAKMSGGVYTLKPGVITPSEEEEYLPTTGIPAAPIVSSPTHPDPEKWYSNNNPEFTWKLPPDITGVSLLLHKNPTANPGPISDGPIESKKYEGVEDGIWYFHIKFKNEYGWGQITHRKVLIDTQPPLPFEIEIQRENSADPRPILLFDTTDETSGIEYYEIKIGDGDKFPVSVKDVKKNPYKMPLQILGRHPVLIAAFDRAGNFVQDLEEVIVETIKPPEITGIPKKMQPGENLIIRGFSYPNSTVLIYIQKEEEKPVERKVDTDENGNFSFVYEKPLEKGVYNIWAKAKDLRGALSEATEKITISATLPYFLKLGRVFIDYLTIIVTLIILIIGTLVVIFYTFYRISLWRKKLRVETKEIAQVVYKAFRVLREEIGERIEYFDKKPGLTEEEKEIRDKLKEALDISEKFIGKEIKDIEKELK